MGSKRPTRCSEGSARGPVNLARTVQDGRRSGAGWALSGTAQLEALTEAVRRQTGAGLGGRTFLKVSNMHL